MAGNITGLYPNIYKQDRRQQCASVESDRRSGLDRRSVSRPAIDPKLKDDIDQTKNIFSALSPVAPIRRIASIPEDIKNGNYTKAAGLLGLAYTNLPEDKLDLKNAYKQIFKGELPTYDYKNYQTPFSFFRGTKLEPIINKMGKLGVKLHKLDKSLFYTKFGERMQNFLNIEAIDYVETGRQVPKSYINTAGKVALKQANVEAVKLSGKAIPKLIGRAMLRIPVLSLFAFGIIELPSIIKAFSKEGSLTGKAANAAKQTVKSAIRIGSTFAGMGIVGALFASTGPAFSLLGIGIGSLIGNKVNKLIKAD